MERQLHDATLMSIEVCIAQGTQDLAILSVHNP